MMKGVCKFFETGKKCPYGDRCRFKHKLSSSNSATPGQKGHNRQTSAPSSSAEGGHPNGSPSNDHDHANLLKKWLYYVPKEKRKSRPLGDDELAKFVGLALKLLESSADNMQLVISVLGEECGLVRVREIIDRNFENMDDDKLEAFIAALLLPYFRILSHDTVLQSMVVETQHTALLNTLYGINGERGSNIFTALARGLSAREDHECIEIVIPVLAGVLERNSSAMANTNLQAAAEVLVSLLDVSNLSRAAERHLRTIKTVLHLAINLSETCAIPGHVGSDSAATFTMDQDLPGALSERGPRHDNDSDDIQDIEILPTLQEILSERTEYLPREDPNLWHIRGLPGLIDRNFRLVREDTVGQLRDAIKAQLYHQRIAGDTPRISEQEVRTNAYHGVSLYNVMFDAKKGLLFVLRFQQPQLLHGKSSKKREDWWQESQRLAPESLICLLSSSEEANQEATFLVVHSPDLGPAPPKLKTTGPSIHKQHTLWKDREHAFVTAQLASTEPFAASDFIKGCLSSRQVRRSLIEFPGVLLPTFGPTLSALQRMAASLDVPFAEALIPDANRAEPRRPAYSVRGGFRYNLRGLLPENLRDQYRNTDNTPQGIASALELSGLDKTQREAAQHALTHAIGLIQGPPGTGKSYTGVKILQALLDNKHAANLGPIICVCYTNHALDQLLENLLDAGISQIVRIGSRSRSERLAGINLRTLAWQHSFTKMEGKHWFDSKRSIEESGQAINQLVQRLRSILRNPEKEIISLLNATYPYFCAQLPQDVDEDGFIVVHGKKTSSCWRNWWKEGPALPFARDRSLAVLRSGTVRLFDMTRGEREALHNSWIDELTSCIYQDLRIELATFNRNKAAMESLRGDVDLRVLSNANVVGVTTTGLARQLGTLSKLRSKVLVVEEAGEVLEAHLLTAMLPSLEHAILIGDHQQLRPKVQNYDLSAENPRSNQIALDVSLFERLIHPRQENVHGLPYVTLETQRRMHPYVSQLIRSTLYPNLQDAESVKTYPEVVGMRKRLFWMDHKKKEDGQRTQMQSASRTNRYEVEMVAALVGHLQKQGVYTANDIAVLTPYLGQLRHLKEKLQNSFGIILNDRDIDELAQEDATKDVEPALAADSSRRRISMTKGTLLQAIRLATVDNFQGEEAKVVIISLVRSNDSNNCGFLRTPNRINVLLSRAKHGMYILGNSATASSVPMWQRILEIFRTEGNIGTVLELSCPRHPDTTMQVTEPEDFSRVAPEAGCDLMCGKQLPCGHACPSKCHAESLHNGVHCLKDCVRPRKGCTHPCKRACGDECEAQCAIIVQCDITLPCGHHVTRMPCWSYQDTARYICREPVERQVPGCGHDVVVACHIAVDDPGYCCQEQCSSTLECGHNCQSACFECRPRNHEGKSDTINHAKCTHRCGRSFTSCVHSCPEQCHTGEPCPPCSSNCEVRCIHSACQKQCHEPCTPCMEEKCPSFCEHAECQMPCGAPCDWVPCSKRCKKVLGCGHQCPSMCGEMCPSSKFCQVCATEEVRDSTVDLYTMKTYADLDLAKTPCLFLPCGHIFTVETLDGQMDISKHYHMDEVEHLSVPVSIKDDLLPLSYENLKTCPNCRGCLRTIARYGRVIRRALLDESTKKFIAWSHQAYLPLAEKIQQKQGELLKTVGQTPLIAEVSFTGPSTLAAAIRRSTAGRYSAFLKLRCAIANFTNKVRAEEQPFQRVRDLVESVRRRQTIDMPKFEYDRSILQTRGTLLAIALGLRCDLVIITDLVRNWESMPRQQRSAKPLAINLSEYRMECDSFHESAMKSKYPLQQAEGHIFWAHFAALECGATLALDGNSLQKSKALKREAVLHLNQATEICRMFPGQTNSVTSEVNGVREMLDKSISSAEMRMVVAVMSREFSVTGHWYCCTNGHPFTIGECGGPMEQTRCPECSAPIGGQRHIAAAGVTRAENIEREFGNLHMEE